ncbi:fasciclin domain-containing protein [Luteimonas sp. R10]|uniref:fasciclin domain-containing protein n=1 Tax=Luteimonas sp. R10 TaxID=3108176 RepID=UPI00309046F6|nr:fasciclin domain-containing protein [Luteimonas sp. R10]
MSIQTSPTPLNVLDTAAANGTFKTFGTAVEKAGMGETLRGAGPFTVFAPTDAAFEQLPAGRLETLFKPENKAELTSILNYHVLSGRKSAEDIGKWDKARTVNGQSAPIQLTDGKISIDGAQVTAADIGSSNGVIHGIDKVNMPSKTN